MLLIAVCLTAASCASTSTDRSSLSWRQLQQPPVELQIACPLATLVTDPSKAGVEKAWRQDRNNLIMCRERHRALVSYYINRDEALVSP
jgi:hypothetical protein